MNKSIIDFLYAIKENNNREWFAENKNLYVRAQSDFELFVDKLIPKVRAIDTRIQNLTAKETMFRIYRDVRFSKDKSPYKTYFGAFIAPGGRKSDKAGYYVHVSPGECFVGGGSYHPDGPSLKKIRSEIYFNPTEIRKILDDKKFKSVFGGLKGESLVRPPKGYPEDFKEMDLLKMKDFTVFKIFTDEEVISPKFDGDVMEVFNTMKPLVNFLNKALES